jgi:hypothetical protein
MSLRLPPGREERLSQRSFGHVDDGKAALA